MCRVARLATALRLPLRPERSFPRTALERVQGRVENFEVVQMTYVSVRRRRVGRSRVSSDGCEEGVGRRVSVLENKEVGELVLGKKTVDEDAELPARLRSRRRVSKP